jgi:ABC-2 type transport system permease protein
VIDAPGPARRPVDERSVRVVSARPSLYRRLLAIWNSRELLFYFVITDIKIKYKSSVLGLLWSLLAPALTLGIYFLVFGTLLKSGIPAFVIFLASGLLIWNFFFNIVSSSTGIVVERAAVVKKVSFPREILALSTVGTSMIYFVMQAIVLAVLMMAFQHAPDWTLLWLMPIAIIGVALVGGALGILLSAVNVYLRDTKHLTDVALQLWFYLTPIVYSFKAKVSPQLHQHGLVWVYMLNPLTSFAMTFQKVLYARQIVVSTAPTTPGGHVYPLLKVLPSWPVSTYLILDFGWIAAGLVAMVFAVWVFGRLEGNFAEEL